MMTDPARCGPRIGSLCSGYGGLDMAVQATFGGTLAWVADPDPGAAAILAYRHPEVANLGDITTTDWQQVERVDVVCGGYPCQPFSDASHRKGITDERHIWPYIAAGLRVLRPRFVVLENVRGHLGRGFAAVLGDLAALGFDAGWTVVPASDVGAPHRRERLFVLAAAADATDHGYERSRRTRVRWPGPSHGGVPAADAQGARWEGPRSEPARCGSEPSGGAPADAQGDGRDEGRPEPARIVGGPDAALSGAASSVTWGVYESAIRRWEHVTGRSAPCPIEPGRTGDRLSPVFVEWLMGLPLGWVTAVPGLSRNAQLKALGNGVVWQQGAAALELLLTNLHPAETYRDAA